MLSAFFTGHLRNRLNELFSGKIQTPFMNKETTDYTNGGFDFPIHLSNTLNHFVQSKAPNEGARGAYISM
ncbi:hypothetical protein CKG00_12605 [Morganella morganii]|uniref:Uncharacterized protein n=1 Tax=Morganella morganii TaxID=582 RepID=A0A433ZYA1_MORMO|nr:hypothetical protein CKG00_12605 [Morganella morganii]